MSNEIKPITLEVNGLTIQETNGEYTVLRGDTAVYITDSLDNAVEIAELL